LISFQNIRQIYNIKLKKCILIVTKKGEFLIGCSGCSYADYSEYFIGHSVSTYWRKKDSEKAEIFRKIEPYLTFLNVHQLERQGADIQSKVEELKEVNQSLRNHDKMKDDAIAHLSDQLIVITERLQEVERRQQV
jgi:hypothetical protein